MTRRLTLTDPDGDQLVVTQHGTSTNIVVSVHMTGNPEAESEFLLTRELAHKLIEFVEAPTEQVFTPAKAAQGRTERVYFTAEAAAKADQEVYVDMADSREPFKVRPAGCATAGI